MSSPSLIEARKLSSGYGNVPVVRELDLQVSSGEVVVLLGANGAGKTTTLLTLAGELIASAGEVLWFGSPTTDPLFKRARGGLALVTEERDVFSQLSVKENLRVGRGDIEFAFELFPELATRTRQRAGLLLAESSGCFPWPGRYPGVLASSWRMSCPSVLHLWSCSGC